MKSKVNWALYLSFPLAVIISFCAVAGLVVGQGPDLQSLPTPTPMPVTAEAGSPAGPDAQAALPDLVVEKIETFPSTPLVGGPTVIAVTIKNRGSGSLNQGNNFFTDLYIDPPFDPTINYHQIVSPTLGLPWGAQWFFVPPGGSYVFTTTWVFTDVKTFDIWAQVDSDGNVAESIEDNNTRKVNVGVLTASAFRHDSHQEFMTNMASTLDNSDPDGRLRLGRFTEPPFFQRPFTNGSCEITSDMTVADYNMAVPDARLNDVLTGAQVKPQLIAGGEGVVIAVWEDGRNGETFNRDIYLRYSVDEGTNWGPAERVNDDPLTGHVNQLNPVAALSPDGTLLVAWQDRRNGDYDIYVQKFLLDSGSLTRSGGNILVGGSSTPGDQINPDIAVDVDGGFHVTWQDNRNGNYDIFATSYIPAGDSFVWTNVRRVNDDPNLTQQSSPAINVIDWLQVTDIDYTVGPAPDYEVTVNRVISEPVRILAIAWEDYREGNADIALAISKDGGETFGFDARLNDASVANQLDPDVILTKDVTTINYTVPLPNGSETQVEVEVPVTSLHAVWQDYRNGTAEDPDPDIYYSASQFGVAQVGQAFDPELTIGANEKINQADTRAWQTEPVIQREPAIAAAPCAGDATEEQWNVFIVWADGRNYDSANYDIYYSIRSTCDGFPEALVPNHMLNDGVRLHNFDTSNPSYDDYAPDHPPPGYQVSPSVATDILIDWPFVLEGHLYVAWQDDRAGNPQTQKDIYFARSNLTYLNHASDGYGAGSQISKVLDSGSDATTWYTVDWWAATNVSTYVTVQTRLGDTITEVLNSAWYPQRFPYQPQPGDCSALGSGAPLPGYSAPGQHIEDAAGNYWPQARYIQYRVNFFTRDSAKTPELDNLIVYYQPGTRRLYLPLVVK